MIARALNPLRDKIFQASPMDYYWPAVAASPWPTGAVSMLNDPR